MIERDLLTEKIIACAYKVHNTSGPGFNEKIYHNALKIALKQKGLEYKTEKVCDIKFENKTVGALRIDLMIEDNVLVEVKAITGIMPKLFEAQVISYLKIAGCKVGLLINFGNKSCQIRRLVLKDCTY